MAMTVVATAQANKPIQLSQQGQASPEESARIRKALADLPVVAVKNMEDPPKQIATVPHASLIGWISEKELLIVEGHTLVAYNWLPVRGEGRACAWKYRARISTLIASEESAIGRPLQASRPVEVPGFQDWSRRRVQCSSRRVRRG